VIKKLNNPKKDIRSWYEISRNLFVFCHANS